MHTADHHTAKHNGTWLHRGRGAHLRCSYGASGVFRDLAEAPGCAVAVRPDAKGLFPEDHPVHQHLL